MWLRPSNSDLHPLGPVIDSQAEYGQGEILGFCQKHEGREAFFCWCDLGGGAGARAWREPFWRWSQHRGENKSLGHQMSSWIQQWLGRHLRHPPFSQFELCFLSLATRRFVLIEQRNGRCTVWTLWDNPRLRQCLVEDTTFQLLQLGQQETRRWRRTWVWLSKDWPGYVLTLGASDIGERWQVQHMWMPQGVRWGHAEHRPEVRGPECGLMCGHRCTGLVYSSKFTCQTSTKDASSFWQEFPSCPAFLALQGLSLVFPGILSSSAPATFLGWLASPP